MPNLPPDVQIEFVSDAAAVLAEIRAAESANEPIHGLLIPGTQTADDSIQSAIENLLLFQLSPDGIAILDSQNIVQRANPRLIDWFQDRELIGLNFYEALGNPPVKRSFGETASPRGTVRLGKLELEVDDRNFRLVLIPLLDDQGECHSRIASLVDCTDSVRERRKLDALHQAGTALADLRPEEIYQMDVEHRIDLLKENIVFYTKDLLKFDVIEIRLLQEETGLLVPLLSVGIEAEQAKRPLYANETGNGVTGYVVATGQSYLCHDTTNDPLYVHGLIGAKSSLTVPLVYHNDVIGSFNVESPKVNAFSELDARFVEAFARDIAFALNTLELLNAQQTNTALQSVQAIHSAVVLPIDEILNDAVNAIDSYQGDNETMTAQLRGILKNARKIKQVIQRVGEQFVPTDQVPAAAQVETRPKLRDKRVLVIDADEEIRTSAHHFLDRFGCIVETAHEGREALAMIRISGLSNAYDAIIADIRLPDIGGYDLLVQLQTLVDDPPLILMTGYGYDPGHSIVKARQAGLRADAVLAKPLRQEQLLQAVEATVGAPEAASS